MRVYNRRAALRKREKSALFLRMRLRGFAYYNISKIDAHYIIETLLYTTYTVSLQLGARLSTSRLKSLISSFYISLFW